MKLMKKVSLAILTVCALILCTALCAANISAADVVDSGKSGGSTSWTLYDDGLLVVSGQGDTANWELGAHVPWFSYRSQIKSAIIEEGVTSIGSNAFYGSDVETVTLPDSLTYIGDGAFYMCYNLTTVNMGSGVERIGYSAFYTGGSNLISSLTLPETLQFAGNSSFLNCQNVTVLSMDASFGAKVFAADATVYGYKGSTVEAYAKENDITFVPLDNAPENACGSNITWTLTDEGELILEGSGETWNWDPYNMAPWNSMADSIQSIVIADGITVIGEFAFAQCTNLTSLTLPDSVTEIYDNAFAYCSSLTEINLPANLTYIGDSAFRHCESLKEIVLPEKLIYIMGSAFSNCISLEEITIPASVTTIGDFAFGNCYALPAINVDENNPNFSSNEGILFNKEQTVLIFSPARTEREEYTIPSTVTEMLDYAFDGGYIGQFNIPANISHINPTALIYCIIDNISVDENNTDYCSVDGILFNKDQTEIIFFPTGNPATEYTIPETVTHIGDHAFIYSKLKTVTIPHNVVSLGREAFYNNMSLREVIISENVTNVGEHAFAYCEKLASVSVLNKDTTFEWNVFADPHESFVLYGHPGSTAEAYANENGFAFADLADKPEIPAIASGSCGDNITWALYDDGTLVFEGTGAMWDYESQEETPYYDYIEEITSVKFQPGITYIGVRALVRYSNIESISIPDTVTAIGSGAFFGCVGLTSIEFPNSITELGTAVIADCYNLESVVLSEKLTSIPDNTFQNNFALKSVTIPESVTSLGMAAFGWCYGLETLTLPKNLSEIGPAAFIECISLESIIVPDSVTTIGVIAFQSCSNLKTVTLSNNITSISEGLFDYCYSLESVNIPEEITSIEAYAFSSCGSLQNVCIPATVTEIGEGAFSYCGCLTIELAEGQEHYICDENGALFTADMTRLLFFPHQSGLDTYAIPNGVTSIDPGAFHDDCSLSSVSIPASVTQIGENAFGAAHFITAYTVDENNPYFSTDEHGVLFNKDKTELIQYPIGREAASYTIPDSVIHVLSEAFAYSITLTDVTIGANVETIGASAFHCCENLNNLVLPETLKGIDSWAFAECYGLTNMTLPENMEFVGDYAFFNSYNLSDVTVLSPNMEFAWDVFSKVPYDTFTLHGFEGSTAEIYAADYGYNFEIAETIIEIPGDINGDGNVDISDALTLFMHSMLPDQYSISYNGNVDFNKDGSVDITDALNLFMYSMLPEQYPLETEGVYASFFKRVLNVLDYSGVANGFAYPDTLSPDHLINISYEFVDSYGVDFTPYREYVNDWAYIENIPVEEFNILTERMWGTVPVYEDYQANNDYFGYDAENKILRHSNMGGRSYEPILFFDSYTVENGEFTVKVKKYYITYEKPDFGVEGEDWYYQFLWGEDAYFVFDCWQELSATLVDGYIRLNSFCRVD